MNTQSGSGLEIFATTHAALEALAKISRRRIKVGLEYSELCVNQAVSYSLHAIFYVVPGKSFCTVRNETFSFFMAILQKNIRVEIA